MDTDMDAVDMNSHRSRFPATARGSAYRDGVISTDINRSAGGAEDDVFFYDSAEEDLISRDTEIARKNQGGRALNGENRVNKAAAKKKTTKKSKGKKVTSDSDLLSHLSPAIENKNNDQSSSSSTTRSPVVPSSDRSDSPLLEPENGDRSSIQLPYPNSTMDRLKRARAIKTEIENNISVLMSQDKKTSTRRNVEEDPENVIIKTLRQEQKLTWSEIANYLNQERRNKGEAATFTDAAVYSRFVRNAPRIATSVGEIGFDPKDYMHLRHPNQYTQAEGTGGISKAGKKRVKNYDNATELKVNIRQAVSSEVHDNDLESGEKIEQLLDAVAKCERNFWKYVADEMERATTKMYDPEELASRYHAI